MEYRPQVCLLSEKFVQDYPSDVYPELMLQPRRPYTCLLIDYRGEYFICVPFRSRIPHNNAYLFSGTVRSQKTRPGLDYSKSAIVKDPEYMDSVHAAIVDENEYNITMANLPRIVTQAVSYVDTYIAHVNGSAPLHPRDFSRMYRYTSLAYFHDILGIGSAPNTEEPSES